MENQERQPEVETPSGSWNTEDTSTCLIDEIENIRSDRSDERSSAGSGNLDGDSKKGGTGDGVLPPLETPSSDDEERDHEAEDSGGTTDGGGGGPPGKNADNKAKDGPATIACHVKNLGSKDYKVREAAQKSVEDRGEGALSDLHKAVKRQNPEASRSTVNSFCQSREAERTECRVNESRRASGVS